MSSSSDAASLPAGRGWKFVIGVLILLLILLPLYLWPLRGGLGALFGSSGAAPVDPHYKSSGGAVAALEAEGFRASRLLAERDGLSFFEGVR